jgi:hypothetical protein
VNLIALAPFLIKAAGLHAVAIPAGHRIARAMATAGRIAASAAQTRTGRAAAPHSHHPPCVSLPSPSPKPSTTTSSSARVALTQLLAMQYQAFPCLLPHLLDHHPPFLPLVPSAISALLLETSTMRPSTVALFFLFRSLIDLNARLIPFVFICS